MLDADTALVREVKVDQKTGTVLCSAVSLGRPKSYTDIPVVGEKPVAGSTVVVLGGVVALAPKRDTLKSGFFDLPPDAQYLIADCNSGVVVQRDKVNLYCGTCGFMLEGEKGYLAAQSENLALRTRGLELFEYATNDGKRVFVLRGAETSEKGDAREYNWTIHVSDGELIVKYCHPEKETNSYIHLRPNEIEAKVTEGDKVSVLRLTPNEATLKLSSGGNQVIRLTPGELHIEAPHITIRADKVDFVKGTAEAKENGEGCNRWEQG